MEDRLMPLRSVEDVWREMCERLSRQVLDERRRRVEAERTLYRLLRESEGCDV